MIIEPQTVYIFGGFVVQLIVIVAVFVKLENRLTTMETSIDFIRNSPQLSRQVRSK